MNRSRAFLMFLLIATALSFRSASAQLTLENAIEATEQTVRFYREDVGVEGGYVYAVSEDLKQREGENRVGPREVWIQPPATPAVGRMYLRNWQLTQLPVFRDAMLETADALIRGQLESGGWGNNIEFDPLLRDRYAYRADHHTEIGKRRNRTTFDDNKSQSCLEFLMLVDRELEFQNELIHQTALSALDAFEKAQYPNGAWPQQYAEFPNPSDSPVMNARFPETWSRTFPRKSYSQFYTLNDNTICDLIELMLTAHAVYEESRWLNCAKRGGDFLLRAQLPEPQPGWAQQYNREMEPAWARKFEPPAITGGESQQVMRTLMTVYDVTGDEKYLKPIPRALEYYRSLELEDGRLARFYEIGTDKPLYFTKDYKLVYRDDEMPTHYAFKVGSKLDRLEREYRRLEDRGASREWNLPLPKAPRMNEGLRTSAQRLIDERDDRGAWVERGELRTFPDSEQSGRLIDTRTYLNNLSKLADFIAAAQNEN
ncbi:MAG: hypothetical protein HUJ26_07800 [Planctomycetaceae bacterium]|nr:hypothetical protein [Planctomycetaceae bacterium]